MLNADPQELAKFSELAHRWWDPESEFRPLHQINPLRLDWIDAKVRLAGKRVVDVGCGGGILADAMARRGADVLGIDLAAKPLKVAQLHALEAGTPRIAYREVAAEALAAEAPGSFDAVTCMEMLEHVPDPASTVRACAALVKADGWVTFSTINRNPKSFLFAIVGAEYVLDLLPKGTHEYARFLRPSELARFCRDAGLDVIASRGLQYNPITRAYWLNDDTSVNHDRVSQDRMSVLSGVRAVLFDLDGTLIDSAPDLAGSANDMRVARGMAPLPIEHLRPMVGAGARGMMLQAFGIGPRDAAFGEMKDEFSPDTGERMTRETRVFTAMASVIDALDAHGMPWGIVTNKVERLAVPITQALGLAARMGVLIGGDSTPQAKPHPEPLLEAARRLGVEATRCIYVGDDHRDIIAGRAAGMRTVAAAWGYLGLGEPIRAWGADALIEEPAQLLKLLALD